MITIEPLASSSAGNAYRISDGQTALLLEAGIPYKELCKALDFQVSQLAGCLVSHEHGDHGRAAVDLLKAGVDIWASEGTLTALRLSGYRARVAKARTQFRIGTWMVLPFETEHDAAEPLGFLLANQSGEKLVFITDSYYVRPRFTGLTHIMIECNFSESILDENVRSGRVPAVMKSRLIRSHFSLENVKDFLRANDLSKVQEVHLLHLSDTNSDEALFKREIQAITGCPVYVAKRG